MAACLPLSFLISTALPPLENVNLTHLGMYVVASTSSQKGLVVDLPLIIGNAFKLVPAVG